MAKGRKLWLHIIVWSALYLFFFSLATYFRETHEALISSFTDILVLFLVYLVTTRFLFTRYYLSERNYMIASLIFIITYTILIFVIDVYVFGPLINETRERPPLIFLFFRILMGVVATFSVATSASLMEHTSRLRENEKLLTQEKLETELKLLKAQINPHFIFNALNNIYSLTYLKAKNAPDSVLKLSEMLRYVFYECNKDRVSLTSEIKYIENFNSFQQMKSEYTQNITLQTNIQTTGIEIAPMLFISFIENAFKYSRIEENEDAYVTMGINQENEKLRFKIENSIPENNKPMSGSGTGIKNVKHRLDIIYPEKYDLTIEDNKNKYSVELSIDL